MEFLGIGYQEILLVFLLMLVFVGPERMPRVAYQIGRAVREMQKYARAVRDEFGEEITYLETQYREVEAEVKQAQTSMRAETARLDREMREATSSVDQAVKDATRDLEAPARPAGAGNVVPLSAVKPSAEVPAPGANGGTPGASEQPQPAGPQPPAADPAPEAADGGPRLVF